MKPEGKAAVDARGHMHVTERPGLALCGTETLAYPLHWDTRTFLHCRACVEESVRVYGRTDRASA